ncbi:hypothetical protein JCM10908_000531 [Rhodotorula pacifica]|uniref:Rtr1/RPAP2 family protein phosphatase n=1 Tax=Rhodotorula pacifica TaxID=1495444 RepID=UPI0031743F77
MPSLIPPPAATGNSRRPTSHFRVVESAHQQQQQPTATATATAAEDAALADTLSLLDRFALSTLTRAAQATAPSVLSVKLAVIERLAAPFPSPSGETTDLIRKALRVLDPSDWDDLVDERWAQGICGFAACGDTTDIGADEPATTRTIGGATKAREPREAYVPREERQSLHSRQPRNLRLLGGSLVQKALSPSSSSSATEAGAFCTERCRAQSEYYRSFAGRGREPDGLEMWDQVERRRREMREETEVLRRGGASATTETRLAGGKSVTIPGGGDSAPSAPSGSLASHPVPPSSAFSPSTPNSPSSDIAASSASSPASSAAAAVSSLASSALAIHERPLRPDSSRRPPAPPTLADQDRDLESRRQQQPIQRGVGAGPGGTRGKGSVRVRVGQTMGQGGGAGRGGSGGGGLAPKDGSTGAYGLPPIRFLTPPREVSLSGNSTSRSTPTSTLTQTSAGEFEDEEEEDEFTHGPVLEGIDDEQVGWLEAALLERDRQVVLARRA